MLKLTVDCRVFFSRIPVRLNLNQNRLMLRLTIDSVQDVSQVRRVFSSFFLPRAQQLLQQRLSAAAYFLLLARYVPNVAKRSI